MYSKSSRYICLFVVKNRYVLIRRVLVNEFSASTNLWTKTSAQKTEWISYMAPAWFTGRLSRIFGHDIVEMALVL